MNSACQAAFLKQYNDNNREQFNPLLFQRSDQGLIEEIKKVILSCQRSNTFTIKVLDFRVIEDYEEINKVLYDYEENLTNKKKKKDNQFKYVNLRESDIILIIIRYYIQAKGKEDTVEVLLCIPRIVNKYYYKISGNLYSCMYQILEGSTYNNANSTKPNKGSNVTLRNPDMAIRIYKNIIELNEWNLGKMGSNIYYCKAFGKSLPCMKYEFAAFGLYGALEFHNIPQLTVTNKPIEDDKNYYSFIKNDTIFINIPKYLFDNNMMVQNVVATIYKSITKDATYEDLFKREYWLSCLGGEFSSYTPEKGSSVLDSMESVYSLTFKEKLRLPIECKDTIHHILRWMMREFNNLKIKDNLDLSFKRIRINEFIASLYSMKICKGLYRISRKNKELGIDDIRKSIVIPPYYLLSAISKSKLVNYRNLVNDLDSITALKYTYKGESGMGQKANTVPEIHRFLQVSDLGRLDPDSSHKSDPGMSGIICPMTDLYDYSFSDYLEPNFWETEFAELMDNYRSMVGLKEVFLFNKNVLKKECSVEEENLLTENIEKAKELIQPLRFLTKEMDATPAQRAKMIVMLEEGGFVYYEQ